MNSIDSIKAKMDAFDQAKEQLDEVLEPIKESYVKFLVETNRLDETQARQNFTYEHQTEDGIFFDGESWDEFWGFGGHEHHTAESFVIPHDFIENSEKLMADVKAQQQKRLEKEAKAAREKDRVDKIARKNKLEKEIAKLQQEIANNG